MHPTAICCLVCLFVLTASTSQLSDKSLSKSETERSTVQLGEAWRVSDVDDETTLVIWIRADIHFTHRTALSHRCQLAQKD